MIAYGQFMPNKWGLILKKTFLIKFQFFVNRPWRRPSLCQMLQSWIRYYFLMTATRVIPSLRGPSLGKIERLRRLLKSDHKFHIRDDEETLYDGRRLPLITAGINEDKMNQKIVDKNLKIINLILILFGLLSAFFIVSKKRANKGKIFLAKTVWKRLSKDAKMTAFSKIVKPNPSHPRPNPNSKVFPNRKVEWDKGHK